MLKCELCFRHLLKRCWQSSIYLRAVWKQFLCHSYLFSVWIAECHGTAMACCSHCVQAAVAAFGVNVTALLVQRDLPSIIRGWRVPLIALLLSIYFCTKSALNEKLKSRSLPVWHALLYVCEFVICSFILNACKFVFLLGNSSAFPWCFAVVSWEDRHWDHFPVVSGCLWYSSASFCCPVSRFFLMLSFAVLCSVTLLSCF